MRKQKGKRSGKRGGAGPQRLSFVTEIEVQQRLGISETTFTRMRRSGLPAAVPGVGPKPSLYDLSVVEGFYVKWKEKQSPPKPPASIEDPEDPMMSGPPGSSPALEEYRRQKARAEKRKNEIAEKRIIDVGELNTLTDAIFDALGAELATIQRTYTVLGNELLEALGRAKAKAAELLPKPTEAAQGQLL